MTELELTLTEPAGWSWVTCQLLLRSILWVTVTFVGSGMAMLVKCLLSLRVETNVRVGIWSNCFLSKCYRWKHCCNIIVVSIVASNVSSYGVIICNITPWTGVARLSKTDHGGSSPTSLETWLVICMDICTGRRSKSLP